MERAAVRAIPERETSVLAEPVLSCGREICGDVGSARSRGCIAQAWSVAEVMRV